MADLTSLTNKLQRHASTLMTKAIADVVEETKEEANKDTGDMARGIRADPISGSSSQFTTTIHVPAPYAEHVIYGTRPHIIRPRQAQALHWVGPSGSIFAAKVSHPGYKGNDFFFEPMPDRFKRALEDAIRSTTTQ